MKNKVYQVKLQVEDAKPPVWRRVLIDSSIGLKELHGIIQIAFEWSCSKLHQFRHKKVYYSPDCLVNDEFGNTHLDETNYKVSDFLKKEKDTLKYEYDFSQWWGVKITLEKKIDNYEGATPICIKGKRAAPIDQNPITFTYEELMQAYSDPTDEDHEDVIEWLGEGYDTEFFDMETLNEEFKEIGSGISEIESPLEIWRSLEKQDAEKEIVTEFWKLMDERKYSEIKPLFIKRPKIYLESSREVFDGINKFIKMNEEYPGEWRTVLKNIGYMNDNLFTLVHVFCEDSGVEHYVTSHYTFENKLISKMNEYWSEVGQQPEWRKKYSSSY